MVRVVFCSLYTMKTNGKIQLYPVLRIAVFLIAGILAGEGLYGIVPLWAWYSAFVLSFAVTLSARGYCVFQTVMIFISFIMLGGCLACHELSEVNTDLPRGDVRYSAVIVSQPVVAGKVVHCDILITDRQRPLRVKANIYRDGRADRLKAGDGIEGVSVLEKPSNFAGSTFDYRRYLLYHGYVATTFLYIDDWRRAAVDITSLSLVERTRIAALRFRGNLLAGYRDMGFSAQDYAVVAAMTLGEKSLLSDELKDDYSVSGASHVLALSGLHLGIIYAVLLLLFAGRKRNLFVQIMMICAIWAYVFIVGMSVSVLRSAIMLTIYSLISLLNRDKMSLNALSVAAVIILLANPLYFYDVGFQMSFVSVMFIFIFYRPVFALLPCGVRNMPVVRWIWQMMSVSVAAQIGVAPLVAFYFGRFSCYFLLTNLIVVPAATVILYGAVFMAVLSVFPPLQALLAKMLVRVVAWFNDGVSLVASLPGASIEGIDIGLVQLLMVYVIIFSLYVLSVYLKKMFWG